MDFIFNSRQKKVEIFYDNETEQKALFEFLSKHMKFKTGGIPTDNVFINGPEISWTTVNTQPPYTISTTNDLSRTITLNNNNVISTIDTEKTSAKLDNSSDEGGYSCLTAYVPRKTE